MRCWALVSVLALPLAAVGPGCGIPRPAPAPIDLADYSTLPNLNRAQESLQDRIAREKEHVEALKLQIAQLRIDEDKLYESFLKAEGDYQLRVKDLAGVETDLATAQHDLEASRARLVDLQAQLGGVEGEIAALLARVTAQRALLTAAQQEFDATLAALQQRLQAALPPPAPPAPAPAPAPEPAPAPAPGGPGGG